MWITVTKGSGEKIEVNSDNVTLVRLPLGQDGGENWPGLTVVKFVDGSFTTIRETITWWKEQVKEQ